MRVLIVSSFPPRHCGIGAYARAQAERLRANGDEVIVLTPPDGAGDVRRPFIGGAAFRHAAAIGGEFDRIVVHFEPGLYFRPGSPVRHVVTAASLWWLVRRRRDRVEILVHEATTPPSRLRPDYRLLGAAFARARLLFHTAAERTALERRYRIHTRATLVPHEESVTVHVRVSRDEARSRLGLDGGSPLFVCAGFLHRDKGLDRAIRAFAAAGCPGRLVVVGSVRSPNADAEAYVRDLRALSEATDGVRLIERFVADDEFDLWILAADRVVLPYRRAWSSGALARSQRLGTPALVANVMGLAEQAGPDDVLFESDEQLATLLSLPATADADAAREAVARVTGPATTDVPVAGAIFGVRLHDLAWKGRLREVLEGFLDGDRGRLVFTPNPEILLRARTDPGYAAVLNRADLALPDGTGVAMILSVRAGRRVRRWPGIDLAEALLRLGTDRGVRVALVGGTVEAAARAAAASRSRHPGLEVQPFGAGVEFGPDGRARPAERGDELMEQLRTFAPRIVLVGLGAPKQERWIARYAGDVPSLRIAIGVGGTFDIWAGHLRRAPRGLHRVGLEWAWRLVLEPQRLPRIVRATIVFPFRALLDRA
ncbi:MAG TPA: WecB/TagA/CpsF family glycosyltransferase [Actinomycetota bacterium]|nr:WecB/TagA/CpsF family glycosyltransferase [Actinomycetota bacterium]